MKRHYYSDPIAGFLDKEPDAILGALARGAEFATETTQTDAWQEEIAILTDVLTDYRGRGAVFFEYSIPRLGRRIDVVVIVDHVVFVLEFKVGEKDFAGHAIDQVWDYALDLKNFHEPSHGCAIAPVLIPTEARRAATTIAMTPQNDRILQPIRSTRSHLGEVIKNVLSFVDGPAIDAAAWEQGRYHPTPTIVEAATALYRGHSVEEISRRDAEAINLTGTSNCISDIISRAQGEKHKAICFVTGVPGAGKTLVGLDIANKHSDKDTELYSVFLSGNGPLVKILCEALARDKVRRQREKGNRLSLGEARSTVKQFIQNVHHFRDDCLVDRLRPPIEHVAIFDEAQRAWDLEQTAKFMRNKKKVLNFDLSEPQFLISCLDRHNDWAVIVCLVGGGQEINTGEAGISEWIESLQRAYPDWHVYVSPRLTDSEYAAGQALERIKALRHVNYADELHLAVSMRSFRAEHVSLLVKQILDLEGDAARGTLAKIRSKYPLVVTRDVRTAKEWLRWKARGSERYGIIVSSQAERLRPHAIHVKAPMDPVHWFLNPKEDVRSSYYLEDVATEFAVQGLELDWTCVTWDADFRYSDKGWQHWSFKRGHRWENIRKSHRQMYLKNSYRVLLTRARQGMVIVVPNGDPSDPTRRTAYYDPTFEYLREVGFEII
ncbi:MAG: DUF2075 domain-containing protein [Planctomycetaceae bacterium]|nr:DUF2075 domain-containing protein [Planctomycetaceae bacterium]